METQTDIFFFRPYGQYGFLSNFYKNIFIENNITFCCSEQYFMYHKCLLFDQYNTKLLQQILDSNDPMEIKKLGRSIKHYDDQIWNKHRYNIMKNGLLLKFGQNKKLCQLLIKTTPKNLYEASPYDTIWGIGLSAENAISIPKHKYGSNLLGKCLMKVRTMLSMY